MTKKYFIRGLNKIFKKRRVLITGHTGFKGSWLSIWLRELGAEILGYSLDIPTDPSNFEASRLSERMTDVRGDVRDFSSVLRIFDEFQPEIVFHLAAQSLVRHSYDNPKTTFETNVMGTVNILEAARKCESVRVIINVTSDKCYENRNWPWSYRENDRLGGHDPYSCSKACSEIVSQSYVKSFFNNTNMGAVTVRAGNVIGGGDWSKDRLLPDVILFLSSGEDIVLRYPEAVRPWQFVLEPLYGYLMLACRLLNMPKEYGGAWNFGPDLDSFITVNELTDKVITCWGGELKKKTIVALKDNRKEMGLLKLNCDKANMLLKWRGILTIDEAIKNTVDWYKTFYNNGYIDMYDLCVSHINEYAAKLVMK